MSSSRGAYHHGSLARALEDAAMQLLEHKPAPEISLREVARAADVSHNAPYHHFTDRRGLLRALAERSMAELVASVRHALEQTHDPRGRMIAGGCAYLTFAVQRPHAFGAVYDPTVCVPGTPTETMAPLIEELEALLGGVAVAANLSTAQDIRSVWALAHGLATLAAAGHFTLAEAEASFETTVDRWMR